MPSNCKVCNTFVCSRNKVTCSDCKQCCHLDCVNMTKDEVDYINTEKQIWRCPPCSKLRRRSMQNATDPEVGKADLSQIILMLKEAKEDRRRMEKEINSSFEYLHNVVHDQKKTLDAQAQQTKLFTALIENVKQENNELKNKIKEFEIKLTEIDQYSRSNIIEIYGIPENTEEDVYKVVIDVAAALGVEITTNSIDVCYRMRKMVNNNVPAGIVVKFVRREDKQRIVVKRREMGNFTTTHLGMAQAATPIYINESLCPGRRKLYAAARQAKTDKKFTYLWIKNGKILMRKEQSAPVQVITTMEDLSKL